MFIERVPWWVRRLMPDGLWRVEEREGVHCVEEREGVRRVYLTFDDGPIPEVTPWVLDVLDHYGVRATFFMVGDNARRYPELVREVMARGHAVGNHTMHHVQGLRMDARRYAADVRECAKYVPGRWFRPPHGWMRRSQVRELVRMGYRVVMYDVVTRDYSRRLGWEDVYGNVKRYVRAGSVVVFHDSLKSRERLEEALPRSLEWLKGQGYGFGVLGD